MDTQREAAGKNIERIEGGKKGGEGKKVEGNTDLRQQQNT